MQHLSDCMGVTEGLIYLFVCLFNQVSREIDISFTRERWPKEGSDESYKSTTKHRCIKCTQCIAPQLKQLQTCDFTDCNKCLTSLKETRSDNFSFFLEEA